MILNSTKCILLYAFLFICKIHAQDFFSGKITYEVKYESPIDNKNAEHLAQENLIDSIVYYIQDGNYKSETYFEGQITESYVYNQQSNWVHYRFPDKDYYLSIDVTTEKMNFGKIKFNWQNEANEILGYSASKAEVVKAYNKEIIYYADQLRVNPKKFNQHKYAYWYETLIETEGRLPIKTIQHDANYVEIREAILIEKSNYASDFFEPEPDFMQVVYRDILDQEAILKELNLEAEDCLNQHIDKISNKLILGKNDNYVIQVVIDETGKPIKANSITTNEDYYQTAEKIILECGFEFEPAIYKGKKVKSELYIPLDF